MTKTLRPAASSLYYRGVMLFEFDEDKDAANLVKHGVSLARAEGLDWSAAIVRQDPRSYPRGEVRQIVLAPLDGRLHVMWFTWRGEICRVIGLRKANKKEIRDYANAR